MISLALLGAEGALRCSDAPCRSLRFCRDLPASRGVAGIPVSVFTDHPESWRTIVRFAFCKADAVLEEGVRRLATST